MLKFKRLTTSGSDEISFQPKALILAGWTGRDEASVLGHIEELSHLGVPAPSHYPLGYRVSHTLVGQTDCLEVLGPHTSGEIEYVVVSTDDGLWLTVGSDQTDRKAEAHGVALSKQLAGKVLGDTLWRLDEVMPHFDQILIRAHAVIDGKRVLYQEGALALIRTPQDLMARFGDGTGGLAPGTVLMSGTLNAIGGVRPGDRFEMDMIDPVLGRSISKAYDIRPLPVIS